MIDAHAHVTFPQFDEDRDAVIERTKKTLSGWLEIGTDIAQSKRAIAFAAEHENVWPTAGVHPSDIAELNEQTWQEIEQLIRDEPIVAVGEVGLDYYRTMPRLRTAGRDGFKNDQLAVLDRFIRLANEQELPVIFHVRSGKRNAHGDLIEYLQSLPETDRPQGVIHTFSGSREQATQYLELGLYLSFSGVVTFPNAGPIADVAATAPLNRILIETDCPFLAPQTYRGKRNEPAYVQEVAAKVAELRGVSAAEVDSQTEHNTRTLFKL